MCFRSALCSPCPDLTPALCFLSPLGMASTCGSLCQALCLTPSPERSRVGCCCGCSLSSSTWASMSNRPWPRGVCWACAAGLQCPWSWGVSPPPREKCTVVTGRHCTTFSGAGHDRGDMLGRSFSWPWVERLRGRGEGLAEVARPQGSAVELGCWSIV